MMQYVRRVRKNPEDLCETTSKIIWVTLTLTENTTNLVQKDTYHKYNLSKIKKKIEIIPKHVPKFFLVYLVQFSQILLKLFEDIFNVSQNCFKNFQVSRTLVSLCK